MSRIFKNVTIVYIIHNICTYFSMDMIDTNYGP